MRLTWKRIETIYCSCWRMYTNRGSDSGPFCIQGFVTLSTAQTWFYIMKNDSHTHTHAYKMNSNAQKPIMIYNKDSSVPEKKMNSIAVYANTCECVWKMVKCFYLWAFNKQTTKNGQHLTESVVEVFSSVGRYYSVHNQRKSCFQRQPNTMPMTSSNDCTETMENNHRLW